MSYIKATRVSDWKLHLASVRSMLPWMFAYDRVNYSRYLSTYWVEMSTLEQTHPGRYTSLCNMDKFLYYQNFQEPSALLG